MGGLQADTGVFSLSSTGGWQTWQDHTKQVTLFAGTNIVRFNIANGPGNYNYFDIDGIFVPTPTPTPVTPTATLTPTNTPPPTNTPIPVAITLISDAGEDGFNRESLAGSGVGNTATNNNNIRLGDENANRSYKGIVSFDTSAIPANATIIDVQLRLRRRDVTNGNNGIFTTFGSILVDLAPTGGFSGNTNLQTTDFQAGAAVYQVTTLNAPLSNGAWAEGTVPLTASVLANIDLSGTTQFRVYFSLDSDYDNTTDRLRFWSGNNSVNSTNRPQLIITYTVP